MFCCLLTARADVALAVARACSPRVRAYRPGAVFDVSGCSRTIGSPQTIANEVLNLTRRWSDDPGTLDPSTPRPLEPSDIRVALAPTVTMAWLLAHARQDVTVVPSIADRTLLSKLPAGWLGALTDLESSKSRSSKSSKSSRSSRSSEFHPSNPSNPSNSSDPQEITQVLTIFERWGLRTLGDVAALPRADVASRLGPLGGRLHQAACGEDAAPFVPMEEAPSFADRIELEWPIEGLEPLAFVLARLCERLSLALERADRGAVTIRTSLRLVTRERHERVLDLPSPMADPRILRTLIILDLESHPPPAAIDIVTIDLEVSPGPIVQGSLVTPTLPTPEDLATLMARLTALVGASRVGAPVLVDTHDARVVGMDRFQGHCQVRGQRSEVRIPSDLTSDNLTSDLCPLPSALRRFVLRRFRLPVAARVDLDRRVPVRVSPAARGLPGGRIVASAGPWRTSGGWWTFNRAAWDRDEWDVELATGGVYRIARDRSSDQWVVEGVLD